MDQKLLSGLTIVILFFFSLSTAVAQTVPFKPLYEEFTSSTCGPCAGANEILDPILEANEESNSSIKYQVNWPGSGDPYYTEECNVRKDYYGVDYAPHLKINASEFDPYNMTQIVYDSYQGYTTSLDIVVTSAAIDEDLVATVTVDLNALADYEAGLTAHIVVVEKRTVGNVMTNGEVEFFNVMMKMLPDAGGTTLPAMAEGTTETLTYSHDMSTTFMEGPNDLAVIVFVQDDNDLSIVQSEHAEIEGEFAAYDLTFNVQDSEGNQVAGAEIFLQSNGLNSTDALGQAVYPGVFSGEFEYEVSAAGLFPATGVVEVLDANTAINVELEVPDYFFYEDFETELPGGWVSHAAGWDFLYWYDGEVIFFRQSGTLDPLMLASPSFDITNAGTIFFSLGSSSGDPEVGFGTIASPNNTTTYEELTSYFPGIDYDDYQFDLADFAGDTEDVHFCWKHKIATQSFFSLTYVVITAGIIDDVSEQLLKEVQVYPNPTSDLIRISMGMNMDKVSLHDVEGKLIESFEVNTNMYSIDVSEYEAGLYTVLIETEKGQVLKSVAVSK